MKTMKFSCVAAVAALLMGAPLVSAAAPDAKKEGKAAKTQEGKPAKEQDAKPAKEQDAKAEKAKGEKAAKAKGEKAAKAEAEPAKVKEAPLPEKPDEAAIAKALKAKKPMYTKFSEAADAAWKCQQPLVAALLVGGDERSKQIEAKALKHKAFFKDFAPANCVLLIWRLKPGKPDLSQMQGRGRRRGPPPKPTTIETRSLKAAESATAKANAKRRGDPEPKISSIGCYPTVVCVDPGCRKLYFRDPKYETSLNGQAAFGAWFSQLVDMFRTTGREPTISPAVQKIVDNPTEPKKWK